VQLAPTAALYHLVAINPMEQTLMADLLRFLLELFVLVSVMEGLIISVIRLAT
jgi:hypothetical protein